MNPETLSSPEICGDEVPKEKPHRKSNWVVRCGVFAIAGVLVILVALPSLLGSKWIYEPLLQRLAQDKFELGIQEVRLSWFWPLEFRGIVIRQSAGMEGNQPMSDGAETPLVSIRSIKTNHGLIGYLLNGRNIGRIEVNQPSIDIALLENGSNLERLVKSLADSRTLQNKEKKTPPLLDLQVAIRGLTVNVDAPDNQPAIQVVPPVDADISYLALNVEPQVVVQPMKFLDHVEITPELVHLGLGMAVPLLAKSAWFDGRVSLETGELRIPLDAPVKSTGAGTLTLHEVKSGPSEPLVVGALDALARLRGKEASHELVFVDGSQVNFKIADERVFHSGLEAGLPKLDPRLQVATQGYVGLVDRSLDLTLEIPIPVEQIARREKIQKLGVPRVKLPIGGTLDHPEIRLDVMRGESASLLALIAGRLQSDAPITSSVVDALGGITQGQADQTIEAAVDFVKQLRERRAKALEEREAAEDKSEAAPKQPRRRPLRDALKKALGGE